MNLIEPDQVGVSICNKKEREQMRDCLLALNAAARVADSRLDGVDVALQANRPKPFPTAFTTEEALPLGPTHARVQQVNATISTPNGIQPLVFDGLHLTLERMHEWPRNTPDFSWVILDEENINQQWVEMGKVEAIQAHRDAIQALRLHYGCKVMSYRFPRSNVDGPENDPRTYAKVASLMAIDNADAICLSIYPSFSIEQYRDEYERKVREAIREVSGHGKRVIVATMPYYFENGWATPLAGKPIPQSEIAMLAGWYRSEGAVPMLWFQTEWVIRCLTNNPDDPQFAAYQPVWNASRGSEPLFDYLRRQTRETWEAMR